MANINGGLMANRNNTTVQHKQASPMAAMLEIPSVKERFNKLLGKKAPGFMSSLLSLVNNNKLLQTAEPSSILTAAVIAATLDLPINPNLGFAYIVPYGKTANFILGYKGLIQLAQRSGQLKSIIATECYEGEIRNFNRFTETFEVGERLSDAIVGYYASIETLNGFKKIMYVPKEDVLARAKKHSKSFNNGPWQTNQNEMCIKSVLRKLLGVYSPLSIITDFDVLNQLRDEYDENGGADGFIDSLTDDDVPEDQVQAVDVETGEILKGE